MINKADFTLLYFTWPAVRNQAQILLLINSPTGPDMFYCCMHQLYINAKGRHLAYLISWHNTQGTPCLYLREITPVDDMKALNI